MPMMYRQMKATDLWIRYFVSNPPELLALVYYFVFPFSSCLAYVRTRMQNQQNEIKKVAHVKFVQFNMRRERYVSVVPWVGDFSRMHYTWCQFFDEIQTTKKYNAPNYSLRWNSYGIFTIRYYNFDGLGRKRIRYERR